jgi:alkylation response protein AidB-like acyl-CoA dehydrogenase
VNLDPTETQVLLRETVASYLEAQVPLDRIRELEKSGGWDEALWKGMCEQGWLGLAFPEALSGGGAGLVDLGILVEAVARRAAIVPILEVAVAGRALAGHARAAELVRDVLSGASRPVPACATPGASPPRVEAGRLRGEVAFVDYGQFATHYLVVAAESGAAGLWRVDAADAAVRWEPLRSIGRTPVCAVHCDGARGERVGDAAAAARLGLEARALAAVQCVGSMAQALDLTVAYAKVREQFGKPIGSFQAVRHHCANMAMRVASARSLAFQALSALDAGLDAAEAVAAAKASASLAAPEVTMLAHQIHGGNGVIEENDLYFFTLRGKERSLAWGSAEECLAELAAAVDRSTEWL